jgi:uncharacterized membrane protein YhaH (DUF805 family)
MKSLLFSFQGRLNRAKWWLVTIGIVVVELILFTLIGGASMMSGDPTSAGMGAIGWVGGIVTLVVVIVAFWVSLAVAVKRWHDRGKSGWWVLIAAVPVVGGLWYLIECGFLTGTTGANAYGPDPLATA